ncbi:hypothetical protein GV794_05295 [Nocardia cyriacigeorgica]|uniref:Uncharacterized protein n=1 Tax=Nocardia cyriacigeorgica TaxID=135487 RepID=A0A6P1D0X6_9NOCA|nr:hypothetical protein [Nocardia cyriacigeorgica]NEW37634.1 hypothetical protein [Nocardia cyriacigeorgica]NEW43234.1 hypothetical protein [Nocardia cyriacigeorgica]NEW48978.1 hypothetical protein [Nocardia cyriacigeorgica]NEW55079.1 hypothetical protein [Nocardia cyriacigeorgica]
MILMSRGEIVATGSWLYADTVSSSVFVIRLGYDFWYEVAREEGTLEAEETPTLDADGQAYYVSFHGLRDDGSFWPDSVAYRSADEAKAAAESRLPSPVIWVAPSTWCD